MTFAQDVNDYHMLTSDAECDVEFQAGRFLHSGASPVPERYGA